MHRLLLRRFALPRATAEEAAGGGGAGGGGGCSEVEVGSLYWAEVGSLPKLSPSFYINLAHHRDLLFRGPGSMNDWEIQPPCMSFQKPSDMRHDVSMTFPLQRPLEMRHAFSM